MKKYFTPELGDLRIGYECELFLNKNNSCNYPEQWKSITLPTNAHSKYSSYDGGEMSELDHVIDLIRLNQVRTPYLTKEQIEAEGWTYVERGNLSWWFEKNGGTVLYWPNKQNHIEIDREEGYDIDYRGECKDINTFRYLCKLLKI